MSKLPVRRVVDDLTDQERELLAAYAPGMLAMSENECTIFSELGCKTVLHVAETPHERLLRVNGMSLLRIGRTRNVILKILSDLDHARQLMAAQVAAGLPFPIGRATDPLPKTLKSDIARRSSQTYPIPGFLHEPLARVSIPMVLNRPRAINALWALEVKTLKDVASVRKSAIEAHIKRAEVRALSNAITIVYGRAMIRHSACVQIDAHPVLCSWLDIVPLDQRASAPTDGQTTLLGRTLTTHEIEHLSAYRCRPNSRTEDPRDETLMRRLWQIGITSLADACHVSEADRAYLGLQHDDAPLRSLIERALYPSYATWTALPRHTIPPSVAALLGTYALSCDGLPAQVRTILACEECKSLADIARIDPRAIQEIHGDLAWLQQIAGMIQRVHKSLYSHWRASHGVLDQHPRYRRWFISMPGLNPSEPDTLPAAVCRRAQPPIMTVEDLIARHILRDLTGLVAIATGPEIVPDDAPLDQDDPADQPGQVLACSHWLARRLRSLGAVLDVRYGYPAWHRTSQRSLNRDPALKKILSGYLEPAHGRTDHANA